MKRLLAVALILAVAGCQKQTGPKPKNDDPVKKDDPIRKDDPAKKDDPRMHEARVKSSRNSMKLVSDALVLFKFDHDRYPEKLQDVIDRPDYVEKGNWPSGGYLKNASNLKDGWGNMLVYSVSGSDYALISYGADGQEGGEGPDLDLYK